MTSDPNPHGFMQGPGPFTDWTPESLEVAWDDLRAAYPLAFTDQETDE